MVLVFKSVVRNAYRKSRPKSRHLRFERFEDRNMLSGEKVDIVFLVDESGSETESATHEWLSLMVEGDLAVPGLDATFRSSQHSMDVRYGLVGFGENDLGN